MNNIKRQIFILSILFLYIEVVLISFFFVFNIYKSYKEKEINILEQKLFFCEIEKQQLSIFERINKIQNMSKNISDNKTKPL